MGYYNVGTVKCDRQMAAAYILYMIAGSWFEKAEMANRIMERKLRGQYLELQERQQEEQEKYVDGLKKRFRSVYFKKLGSLRSEVHLKRSKGIIYMWFQTGFEELIAFVDGKGRIHIEKGYAISREVWMHARAVPAGQGRKKIDVTKTEPDKKIAEVVKYGNPSSRDVISGWTADWNKRAV